MKLFNPRKSFFELSIVKWTGFGLFLFALIVSSIIWFNGNYGLCGKGECFNLFINEFKFPIGLLALLIPIGAIYAAQHRSELTIAQIKAAEDHNNFSNYYKHIEEFEKYIGQLKINAWKIDIRKLHSKLFSNCRMGDMSIDLKNINFIIKYIKAIYKIIKFLEDNSNSFSNKPEAEKIIQTAVDGINEKIINLSVDYYFSVETINIQRRLNPLSSETEIIISKISDQVNELITRFDFILSFCTQYQKPVIFKVLQCLECSQQGNYNYEQKLSFNLIPLDEELESFIKEDR
jgi:hypothetical protein